MRAIARKRLVWSCFVNTATSVFSVRKNSLSAVSKTSKCGDLAVPQTVIILSDALLRDRQKECYVTLIVFS